ncbi:MAG: hypothetical protein HZB44_08755 [Actinobacteria bacterium]|nr:hypothetical protein [Actinomycetota bacterium]
MYNVSRCFQATADAGNIAPLRGAGNGERVSMWYIEEVPFFFFANLIATILILSALAFGIPPFINWLMDKMHQEN